MSTAEAGTAATAPAAATQGPPSLAERVAALEERTAPRPKSALDRLKDWGGVASLLIALGYSFPLGLWDRFVTTAQARASQELAQVRSVIEESTVILADGARTVAAIQDPYLRDWAGRAVNTRIFLVMTKHRDVLERNKDKLTAPELLVVANNFIMTGQPESATPYLDAALNTKGVDVQSRFEALRQRGKIHFLRSSLSEARKQFREALVLAEAHPLMRVASMSLTAEWAVFELTRGDWACGQDRLGQARKLVLALGSQLNDSGNFVKLMEGSTAGLVRQPSQPAEGCG